MANRKQETAEARREASKSAVDLVVESADLRKRIASCEKVLAYAELAVEEAEAELEATERQLKLLGFDTSKPIEPQLETLRIKAEQAMATAQRIMADLGGLVSGIR